MTKKLINGCLILIIILVALAVAYLIWTFTMMSYLKKEIENKTTDTMKMKKLFARLGELYRDSAIKKQAFIAFAAQKFGASG